MVLFGLTVEVFTLTGKSTSVSLLILSFLVPSVIFGAIAGVYVDRLDRRLILVSTNAVARPALPGAAVRAPGPRHHPRC